MQTSVESTPMGLRRLRQQRGLTLEAVACLAGDDVDIATISRIERGLVKPRPQTIVTLARALGVSVGRLRQILAESGDAV
jgi:transcriptional regulator with XRE-family HTH domain